MMETVSDKTTTEPSSGKEQQRKAPDPEMPTRGSQSIFLAKFRERLFVHLAQIGVVIMLVVLWQLIAGHVLPLYATSRPSDVWSALVHYLGGNSSGWTDIQTTASEAALGYVIGVGGGVTLGLTLGSFPKFGQIVQPVIAALNAVPMVALAPLLLIVTGIGLWSKVVLSALIVFFIVFYNTYYGRMNASHELRDVVKVCGGRGWAQIRYVVVPGMLPSVLAAMRTGVAFSMIGAVVGEFVASANGLGWYVINQGQLFNTAGSLAGIIVMVMVVLLGQTIISIPEKFLLRWKTG